MGKGLLTLALVNLFICGGGIFSVDANDLIGKEISNQRMSVRISSMFEAPAELIKDPAKAISDPARKPLDPSGSISKEVIVERSFYSDGKVIIEEPGDKPIEEPSKVIFRHPQKTLNPLLEKMLNFFEFLEPGTAIKRTDGWVAVKNKDGSGYIRNNNNGACINFGRGGKLISIIWPWSTKKVFNIEN